MSRKKNEDYDFMDVLGGIAILTIFTLGALAVCVAIFETIFN